MYLHFQTFPDILLYKEIVNLFPSYIFVYYARAREAEQLKEELLKSKLSEKATKEKMHDLMQMSMSPTYTVCPKPAGREFQPTESGFSLLKLL